MKNSKINEEFQEKIKNYEVLREYSWSSPADAAGIRELIHKGISICNPSEKEEKNTILDSIVRHAKTEKEAIELLRLIYEKEDYLFRELDKKGVVSLIYIAVISDKKEVFKFLLDELNLPVDSTAGSKHTPLYEAVASEGALWKSDDWTLELVRSGADPYLIDTRNKKCPFYLIKSNELKEKVKDEHELFKKNQQQKKEIAQPREMELRQRRAPTITKEDSTQKNPVEQQKSTTPPVQPSNSTYGLLSYLGSFFPSYPKKEDSFVNNGYARIPQDESETLSEEKETNSKIQKKD